MTTQRISLDVSGTHAIGQMAELFVKGVGLIAVICVAWVWFIGILSLPIVWIGKGFDKMFKSSAARVGAALVVGTIAMFVIGIMSAGM